MVTTRDLFNFCEFINQINVKNVNITLKDMEKWAASQNKRKSTIVITKPNIHMETKVSATVAAVAAAFEPQEKHEPIAHTAVVDEKPSAAIEAKFDTSPIINMNESLLLDEEDNHKKVLIKCDTNYCVARFAITGLIEYFKNTNFKCLSC